MSVLCSVYSLDELCSIFPSRRPLSHKIVSMSFNLDHLASISLASAQIAAWSVLTKCLGFVSGPIGWVSVAALTGFVVAKIQRQKSFRELRDASGNTIPDGPRNLPILGKCSSQDIMRIRCEDLETEPHTRILPVSDPVS